VGPNRLRTLLGTGFNDASNGDQLLPGFRPEFTGLSRAPHRGPPRPTGRRGTPLLSATAPVSAVGHHRRLVGFLAATTGTTGNPFVAGRAVWKSQHLDLGAERLPRPGCSEAVVNGLRRLGRSLLCRPSSEESDYAVVRYSKEMTMTWQWANLSKALPAGFPTTCVDIAAPLANPGPTSVPHVYFVGSDGSLWRCAIPLADFEQVPTPGKVTRVAVYPNGSVACVTKDDPAAAYILPNGNINGRWDKQNQYFGAGPNYQPFDVCAARDGSVWFVLARGQQWIATNHGPTFEFEVPALIAVAGFTQPVSDANAGGAWGIVGDPKSNASGSIAFCNGAWELRPNQTQTYLEGVVDISTSPNYLWMVKTDGTVWTTQDGISEIRMGSPFLAQRISGGYISESDTRTHLGEVVFAIGKDGVPNIWQDGPL
jgi:hypothetical protein